MASRGRRYGPVQRSAMGVELAREQESVAPIKQVLALTGLEATVNSACAPRESIRCRT